MKYFKDRILRDLLLLQSLTISIVFLVYGVRSIGDSVAMSYSLDMFYILEPDTPDFIKSRFLRPLGLWFAFPLKFLGNENALAIISLISQILIIPFFYYFSLLLTKDIRMSKISVLFFIFSPMVIYHTLRALVDMETWFLYLITLYFSYSELQKDKPRIKIIFLLSFFCGISSLMKEFGGSSIIYINLMILLTDKYKSERFERIAPVIICTILFLIPLLINSFIVYKVYDYTYYDWIMFNRSCCSDGGIIEFIASFKNAYGLLLPFAVFYYFKKEKYRDKELSIILFSSLFLFMISIHSGRYLFVSFPIIIPLAVMGVFLFVENVLNLKGKTVDYALNSLFITILLFNHFVFVDNDEYIINLFL